MTRPSPVWWHGTPEQIAARYAAYRGIRDEVLTALRAA